MPAKVAVLTDFMNWAVDQYLDDRHQGKNCKEEPCGAGGRYLPEPVSQQWGGVCAAGCANFLMNLSWEGGSGSPYDINQHCYFESSGVTVTYTSWIFWKDCIICHTVLCSSLEIRHYAHLDFPYSFNRGFSFSCNFIFWPTWFCNVLSNWKPAAGISN